MNRLFLLPDAQQAHRVLNDAVWPYVKAATIAGQRLELVVRPETRSGSQNRMLHALIGEIADRVPWAGARRDADTWKRLLTAAWLRARGESVEILPALDGHGVDVVFRRTSSLTRAECAELLDFVQAWAATNGIELPQREAA